MKLLLIFSLFLFSLITIASEAPYSKDRVMVMLNIGAKMPVDSSIKRVKNLFGDLYVVYTDDVDGLATKLEEHLSVKYVEKDYISTRDFAKVAPTIINETFKGLFNDPSYGKQWHLNGPYGVGVEKAHEEGQINPVSETIVAVVDTGVEYDHEDLKDVMWVNAGEIPNNNIDDDGNGYIDDVYGINTLNRDSDGNATGKMRDTQGHGTHVSGIIGAKQNNNTGVAGVASNVKIMGIRTVPNWGDEKDVDVVEAFIYAAKNGAKVINCSFGKDENEGGMAVSDAIKYIGEEFGVLVVNAAGNSSSNNDSKPTYPSSFTNEHLLVVASSTSSGSLSYFSNYGKVGVDLAAPGSSVYSTDKGNRYASNSGTSMASPVVAGVAAEVLSHYPDMGPLELKKLLMDTVQKNSSWERKLASPGVVNLYNALAKAKEEF